MIRLLLRRKLTGFVLGLIWLVYLVELWIAGSIEPEAAFPVARNIARSWIGPSVAFLLHSYHGHILFNSVYLVAGGFLVEPHVDGEEFTMAIILGGWITTLGPQLINGGSIGLSGVTNQLCTFAAVLALFALKNADNTGKTFKYGIISGVLFLILLFSIVAVSEGASVVSHLLGILWGVSWFWLSEWKGTLSLEVDDASYCDV